MRLPRGAVPALLAAGVLLAAAAGGARAEPPVTTTVPVPGTTTSETTTAPATTTAPTTTAAATTATATTTATPRRKKSLVRRSRAVAGAVGGATYADRGCFVAAVALVLPGRAPFVLGPVAEAPSSLAADLSRLAYPTDGSIVTAGAVDLQEVGCGAAQRAHGTASIEGLSLFRGAVEATAVSTRFTALRQASAIGGLRISGRAARVRAGTRAPVGDWGSVSVDTRLRLAGDSRLRASGLSVHLLKPHAGLPAGADVLVAFAALPAPAAEPAAASAGPHRAGRHRHHRRHRKSRPLTVTPPLGLTGYVFPIAGIASFGDSYGGFRSDVAGNWHHGDDLFAALGTPVVAVASGTLNRVGWEPVGGWRLWVRDDLGNEFYYAHLSGYAPNALHSKHVRAGEVIGFVGNSGDAFTTPPHVHFEIHPRRFLHLHYNGAVDPTTYLEHWPRLAHVHAPRPVHPQLPAGAARTEARYIFRELLAARHLISHAPPPPLPQSPLATAPVPAMPVPGPVTTAARPASAAARAHGGLPSWELVLVAFLAALALAALAGPVARAVQRRIVSA